MAYAGLYPLICDRIEIDFCVLKMFQQIYFFPLLLFLKVAFWWILSSIRSIVKGDQFREISKHPKTTS